jgi:MATE family multidrug resistance protein
MSSPSVTSKWSTDVQVFFSLALPLMLTNLGTQLLDVVDTIIVGRIGALELGAIGLGNEIYYGLAYFGMGVIYGFDPLMSQAVGAREKAGSAGLFWQSIYLAVGVAVVVILIGFALQPSLRLLGVPAEIARLANLYLSIRIWDLFPLFLMIAGRIYLQAHDSMKALVVGIVTANLINAPLDLILVFGDSGLTSVGLRGIGLPPLGIAGAALASVIAMVIQSLIVLGSAIKLRRTSEVGWRPRAPNRDLLLASRLGFAVGLQVVCEVSIFLVLRFLMATHGVVWAAAHEVGMSFFNFTGTIAMGVGAALSVRVGLSVGGNDSVTLRRTVYVATTAMMACMGLYALAMFAFPLQFVHIITGTKSVLVVAPAILAIVAPCTVADCHVQLMLGALRGIGDTRGPLIMQVVLFFALGLPLSLFLTSHLAFGPEALWCGPTVTFALLGLVLSLRFNKFTKTTVARVSAKYCA